MLTDEQRWALLKKDVKAGMGNKRWGLEIFRNHLARPSRVLEAARVEALRRCPECNPTSYMPEYPGEE